MINDQEMREKVSKIIANLRGKGENEVIEKLPAIIGLEDGYIKLYVADGNLNATIMTPKVKREDLISLLPYIQIMLEDLALSLGLNTGAITILTMQIH
ncbi:MAG: hypothetical protein QXX09_03195 [Candidatus Methanomethylicia archaeon]